MATNLSSLAPLTTKATALSNLLLVTPKDIGYQPQNPDSNNPVQSFLQQPTPILFHYEGEQTVTLQSDITDHYTEFNSAIQDQIAIKPTVITTHGFIGELNDVPPFGLALLKSAVDKLSTVGAYAPGLSVTAQNAYNEAFFAYQIAANALNSAVSAFSSIGIGKVQNRQQEAFSQFYAYFQKRTLFTVQTPWAIFQNMAIQTLRAVQDSETRVITDFEITFKEIRFASTAFVGLPNTFAGRAAIQNSDPINIGDSQGQSIPNLSPQQLV